MTESNRHWVGDLLLKLEKTSRQVQDMACELYESDCVSLEPAQLPAPNAFAYHLDAQSKLPAITALTEEHCVLCDGTLAKSNGVVFGPEHSDLRCSRHPCSYDVCPCALAACFCMHRTNDPIADIPLYDRRKEQGRRMQRAADAFKAKWLGRLRDSDLALSLLCSQREDDFAGSIVVEDRSYLEDFVKDIARVLVQLGKIDKGSIQAMHLSQLLDHVDASKMRFAATQDENLRPRTLYVFDRVADFFERQSLFGGGGKDFVIERLGHIVNERYVILVGTEAELSQFCAQDSRYLLTFDTNRMKLAGMDASELYRLYLDYLDAEFREEALARPGFEQSFHQYVTFNGDWIPFKGRELADFLAKHANGHRELSLPKSRYQSSSLEEMLNSVVGLSQVKDTIRQLEHYAVFRKTAQNAGRELPPSNMHMLFMGNPGTGKTTIARIVSTMLYKIGIIRQNKCIEVTSKDLVAGYVGQTDKRTAEVIGQALGGILFIDEAYSLAIGGESSGASFGKEAIAELVKAMEDHKDDLIVIFAGYEKEMGEFLETNPGLTSRIGYTFRFQDYSTDELLELFKLQVKRAGFTYDARAIDREARAIFEHHRRFKSFGNGRFVTSLVQKAIIKHANGLSADDDYADDFVLRLEDMPSRQEMFNITDWSARSAKELLEPLIGMDALKEKVCRFEEVVRFYSDARQADLKLPDLNMHMMFTGNPGTGKTTVARIIAAILYNVGAVPTNKFIEIEARDLTAFQFNSSKSATERILEDAMGGVLFIDEAYALLYTNGGDEVIAQLVKAMEDHKGEFSLMFAGYRREMREFTDRNPGLASRIGYTFDFDDYDAEELQEIFDLKISRAGLHLGVGARKETGRIFKYFHNVQNFGNGRFVDKLIQEVLARHAHGFEPETIDEISRADIPSIEDMCKIVSMPVYEPSDVSDEESLRRVAYHEMGHAVCRLALTGETDIIVVTIEQEGNGALGYVQHKASAAALPTSEHLMNDIVELMGGMAAEHLRYGDYSAGNSSDLQKATAIASRYVATYGMSEAGYVQYLDPSEGNVPLSQLPPSVREAINELMGAAFSKAQEVIRDNQSAYDQLVEIILEEGTISGERITELWGGLKGGGARE